MKKVALVSVHNDPNFGSALQAYALAYAIQREGYECEYLNYTLGPAPNSIKSRIKKAAKSVLYKSGILSEPKTENSFWRTPEFKVQRELFKTFHDKRIPFSSKVYGPNTIKEANKDYDCFIVGSDQTWSPYVTKSKHTINFLDFVEPGRIKASYAPSLGTCHLEAEYIELLKEKLSGFNYLSCREKHNADLLSERFGRKVEHVLDPTLLLSREEWLMIAEPVDMPEHYILCYILGAKQCISDFAERIGKEQSLPVYYIGSRPEYLLKENALNDITPGQFITLISQADYVVTDSFHGSLFSINFQRQFYAFTKREITDGTNDNDRIRDFLTVLDISERLKEDYDYRQDLPIDYAMYDDRLKELSLSSMSYLSKLLKSYIVT
ncbi:MAG: polysaccharide pyruvyl transferase family protein [Bacteroidales bacterium]|nr:polysaccharide pyruvyl transferase family protein [Bacteroidales bacterium]